MTRRGIVAGCALLMFTGCTQTDPLDVAESVVLLDSSLPIGAHLDAAVRFLESRRNPYHVFSPSECDGFVIEPRLKCRGGSGVLATIGENLWSWRHPFYDPDLRVFLAFDGDERLADRITFLEGGD